MGQYERAIAADAPGDIFVTRNYALATLGRGEEVLAMCRQMEPTVQGAERGLLRAQRASVEGDRSAILEAMSVLLAAGMRDPEGIYMGVRSLALLGLHEEALRHFERVVQGGYFCVPYFMEDPWLDGLREHAGFAAIMDRAEAITSKRVALSRMLPGRRSWGSAPAETAQHIAGRWPRFCLHTLHCHV